MMPPTKAKVRAFKSSSVQKSPASQNVSEPPAPYKRALTTLEPLLSKLDKSHIYITHVDTKPRDFKQKIFMVPVAMNVAIIGLIIWRIKSIGPWYMKICFSLMGKPNDLSIQPGAFEQIMWEIVKRVWVFVLDLLIYIFIWPWPRDFFAGRTIGNPIGWRFGVGFREKEIIVRRSRKWDRLIGNLAKEGEGQTELFEKVRRATDSMWMNEKTGYLMLTNEWDLDWKAMIIATKLVDNKTMSLEDFKTTILVHLPEFGWTFIETGAAGGSAKEEEGRRKIVAFKDELTALGKESLFFRWIELVQFESSQPGGFGPEQQQKTMDKAKAMFESQGVDFDKFWAKVGGMEGMPGMDQM